MSDPKNPIPGERAIDVNDLDLIDVTPDHIQKLPKLRDGHAQAVQCVLLADPAIRKQAGLSEVEVEELGQRWAKVQRIQQVLPAARKLVELLEETSYVEGGDIASKLTEMAHQIRRRSARLPAGDAILAAFEDLSEYQFAIAQKSADKRARAKAKATASPAPAATPA